MRDHGGMDALDALSAAFDGCVDPRELVSKLVGQDPSEVHTNAPLKVVSRRRKPKSDDGSGKVLNRVGQGLNALAMGAGTHALVMAGRDERIQEAAAKGSKPARALAAPYKAWSKTKLAGKIGAKSDFAGKYALPLAAGAVGLHSAELVGDSIAAHALHQQAKTKVRKNVELIVKARAMGAIDNDRAIELAAQAVDAYERECDLIEKALIPKLVNDTLASKATRQKQLDKAVDEIVPHAKKVLAGAAITGGVGVSAAAGAKGQRMLDKRRRKSLAAVAPGPIVKAEDVSWEPETHAVEWTGTVSKFDTDKRLVFGWCSISKVDGKEVVDLQGDYIPIDETETSAYRYVIHSRKGGDMHRRVTKRGLTTNFGDEPLHTSDLVESMVVTPEKLEAWGLAPDAMPLGWWVGFKVNDEQQWQLVKEGKRPSFSIHGSGKRVEDPQLSLFT